MKFTDHIVTQNDTGRRLDRVLRRMLPDIPLSKIYTLIRKGLIRVDGKRIKPEISITNGSVISIADVEDTQLKTKVVETTLVLSQMPEILYETDDLLFINKESGVVVHGEDGLDTLVPQSKGAVNSLSFRSGPLHRLDRGTTGIIAFSKSLEGARWFSSGIHDHLFDKFYIGIVEGSLNEKVKWLDFDEENKEMVTIAQPLFLSHTKSVEATTLVLFKIITGRKHQIRKQSSKHGHPLWGDSVYKSSKNGQKFFLHAWQLHFPVNNPLDLPTVIVAPLPKDFHARISLDFPKYVLAQIELGELYWRENEEL